MAIKLFVGSLPYSVTSDQLKDVFAEIGEVVSATVIIDRYSNQSKGFGFVEMSSDDEAKKAIAELDGKEYEGRKMIVNEARPQEKRERRPDNGGGGYRENRDRDNSRDSRRF